MIQVYIFNKSNNASRFDIFKKFFECVNSKISLTCCTKTDAVRSTVHMFVHQCVTKFFFTIVVWLRSERRGICCVKYRSQFFEQKQISEHVREGVKLFEAHCTPKPETLYFEYLLPFVSV